MLRPFGFIEPCLPTNARVVPDGPQWAYEIKHDGFRFICCREGDLVRVFSRRGIDHSDRAPTIAEALLALNVRSVTIDGEGVVCGPDGVTDFDRLRAAMGRKGSRQLQQIERGTGSAREPWRPTAVRRPR